MTDIALTGYSIAESHDDFEFADGQRRDFHVKRGTALVSSDGVTWHGTVTISSAHGCLLTVDTPRGLISVSASDVFPGLDDALRREYASRNASLSFAQLRAANIARLPQFKNKHGEPAHSQPDGSDWSISDWLMAVTGELGELANLRKKVLRGDLTHEQAQQETADELADIQTYLDILAFRLGVDLGAATTSKFNRVSERVQCNVRLPAGEET